ncbi:transposon Ty3-I Gag-Pol polyprotein [Trichonephila clavipes]|nr:transposon Ty3-I Gag-Pol polyprotein [Trichonephila clavipes]
MSESPILHLYKYGRKTELHTDAYKQGFGAILLQEAEDGKLHQVKSKKTNTAEEKQHFKIVTDCSAFQKTMQKKELITRIARWALQLEEFDYEIEHRAGSRMKHVDALSRYPVMMSENRKTYNRRRKKASLYKEGDLVAIQRTQFGAGLKLRPKFLGPYKVTKVNSKDRNEVEKVGQHEGPNSTTISADLMKHFYA